MSFRGLLCKVERDSRRAIAPNDRANGKEGPAPASEDPVVEVGGESAVSIQEVTGDDVVAVPRSSCLSVADGRAPKDQQLTNGGLRDGGLAIYRIGGP